MNAMNLAGTRLIFNRLPVSMKFVYRKNRTKRYDNNNIKASLENKRTVAFYLPTHELHGLS